jgi:tetratricopeptide (TPR) repeat protein/NAD-dependent SIR2 family protein deacetylase
VIRRRSNSTPNFALLIGAGASVSSGVKSTRDMIVEWRHQLHKQSHSKGSFEEWLKEQDWYMDDEEYSILFEKVYDRPSQRRNFIEECLSNARASWGYIYVSNILAHNYFNVVLTPNFDDLLNEACFVYSDLRPIVCAHDSAVADIRITSARTKIIKLHGDFLYDSIKNTVRETESLEKNMRDKFRQFAREYGLVVVGYGGNDRSIMDVLDVLLRSEGFFPHGLYWCVRSPVKASKRLRRLMQRENTYWVEIEGFDEFMAELHNDLGLVLPDAVRDPYKATTKRLNAFIRPKEEVKHPIIMADISKLEEDVKLFEQAILDETPMDASSELVPYVFLANREYSNNNYEKAILYYEKALSQNPTDTDMMWNMVVCYLVLEDRQRALEIAEEMIRLEPNEHWGYVRKADVFEELGKLEDAISWLDQALEYAENDPEDQTSVLIHKTNILLMSEKWEEALAIAEGILNTENDETDVLITTINKCIALKALDRNEEADKILLELLPKTKKPYNRANIQALLGNKEKMLEELAVAIREDRWSKLSARIDPDFAGYREDPQFRKLVNGDNAPT